MSELANVSETERVRRADWDGLFAVMLIVLSELTTSDLVTWLSEAVPELSIEELALTERVGVTIEAVRDSTEDTEIDMTSVVELLTVARRVFVEITEPDSVKVNLVQVEALRVPVESLVTEEDSASPEGVGEEESDLLGEGEKEDVGVDVFEKDSLVVGSVVRDGDREKEDDRECEFVRVGVSDGENFELDADGDKDAEEEKLGEELLEIVEVEVGEGERAECESVSETLLVAETFGVLESR